MPTGLSSAGTTAACAASDRLDRKAGHVLEAVRLPSDAEQRLRDQAAALGFATCDR